MSAARDWLDVRRSIACGQCGGQFVPVARPGGRGHRFCSRRCRMDAENARKRFSDAGGKRPETLVMPFPVTELEAIPWEVWIFGLCVILPEGRRHYWTSDDEADITVAKAYCRACAARIACADWAIRNLPRRDNTMWGGLDGTDRRRLRRQARTAAPLAWARSRQDYAGHGQRPTHPRTRTTVEFRPQPFNLCSVVTSDSV